MKRLIALASTGLFLTLSSLAAEASTATNAIVVDLTMTKAHPDVVFIRLASAPTGKPACSIHNWAYTLPLTTAFEQKIYAMLLTALASGRPVNMSGWGTCNEHGEVESLHSASILE